MLRVFNAQLITGDASGLKKVAPLAGFSWDVNEPGGAESMLVYDSAVGSPNDVERQEARRWLLDYNRGDVAATFAIRDWLERAGESIGPVESAEP